MLFAAKIERVRMMVPPVEKLAESDTYSKIPRRNSLKRAGTESGSSTMPQPVQCGRSKGRARSEISLLSSAGRLRKLVGSVVFFRWCGPLGHGWCLVVGSLLSGDTLVAKHDGRARSLGIGTVCPTDASS